jgi:hypothetical protein
VDNLQHRPHLWETPANQPNAGDNTGVNSAPEPQDHDAEDYVLGAILLDARAIDETRSIISGSDFSRPTRGSLYDLACAMRDRGEPIDLVTVAAESARTDNPIDRSEIVRLAAIVPAWTNAPSYARIVRHTADARNVIDLARNLTKAGRNGGLNEHPDVIDRMRELLDGKPRGTGATVLDLDELLAGPVPETDWIWNGWIAWEDIALIVGDPKTGKSLLTLGLANQIRQGGIFLGERCDQARVGIFDLENPLGEVHKRLRRVGLTHEDNDGLTYVHAPAMNLATHDGISQFEATVEEHQIDVAVIDSFRRAAPGIDENDSAAISAFFAPLRRMIAGRRRSIIVVHHARKRTGGDQDQDAGQMTRGSGDFMAAIDTQIYLRKKEAGSFAMHHGASRRGLAHDSIIVSVSGAEEETLEFTSEGKAAAIDHGVEGLLHKIVESMRDHGGGPFSRLDLAGLTGRTNPKDGTLRRSLDLGESVGTIASAKDGNRTIYSLTEASW